MIKYVILISLITLFSGCSSPDSDDQLSKLLKDNQLEFDKLVSLSDQCLNKIGGPILWASEAQGANSICGEIMIKTGVRAISKDNGGSISFYIEDYNYSSHQKGLTFSLVKMEPRFKSFDQMPSGIQPYERGYKQIQENWYIHYEHLN
jgi:hypothetical protein